MKKVANIIFLIIILISATTIIYFWLADCPKNVESVLIIHVPCVAAIIGGMSINKVVN